MKIQLYRQDLTTCLEGSLTGIVSI